MYGIKRARKFDGVTFIVSKEEYDCLIWVLKEEIEKDVPNERPLNRLIVSLTEYPYFDKENKEVHCMLGYREIEALVTYLIAILPQKKYKECNFDDMIDKPETKIWVNRGGENSV